MTDHEPALTVEQLQQRRKKLWRRHEELVARSQKALLVQQKIERRVQRLQDRLRKKTARAQRLGERVLYVQQQLDAIHADIERLRRDHAQSEQSAESTIQEQADIQEAQRMVDEQTEVEVRQELQTVVQQVFSVMRIAEKCAVIACERARYAELRLELESPGRHLVDAYEMDEKSVERTGSFAQQMAQAAQTIDELVTDVGSQNILTAVDDAEYRVHQVRETYEVVRQVDRMLDLVRSASKSEVIGDDYASRALSTAFDADRHAYAALRSKQTLMINFLPALFEYERHLVDGPYRDDEMDKISIDHEI